MWRRPAGKKRAKVEWSLRVDTAAECKESDPSLAIWNDGTSSVCPAVTCGEALKQQAQRIGNERTAPEEYWRGKKNENDLHLRIVKRGGDNWLQLWDSTQSVQIFQLRDVTPEGITWAKEASKDYESGRKAKPMIEIEKRSYMSDKKKKDTAETKKSAQTKETHR